MPPLTMTRGTGLSVVGRQITLNGLARERGPAAP